MMIVATLCGLGFCWAGTHTLSKNHQFENCFVGGVTYFLTNAVRIAFRAPLVSPTPSNEETWPKQTIIQRRHRDAIDVSNLLSEQLRMWSGKSSISVERGVRVVATSACLMRSSAGVGVSGLDKKSYKFAYRIRVENVADLLDARRKEPPSDDSGEPSVEHRAVQLLGRTWRISECRTKNQKPSSLLQRLLEDGALIDENNQGGMPKKSVEKFKWWTNHAQEQWVTYLFLALEKYLSTSQWGRNIHSNRADGRLLSHGLC